MWYLCEAAQRCERAIYLTVIDVAVVSVRDIIIRADYEDPFLRTRHDVPPESAREENGDEYAGRRRVGYSPGSILALKMEIRSFSIKIGRIHASHDLRRMRWKLRWYSRPICFALGQRICIYLSQRVIGRSIMLQMKWPELLSLVSCFTIGFSAIYFFGFIITKSSSPSCVNYLSQWEKVRQLWWSATICYSSKNRYNGTCVGTWSRNETGSDLWNSCLDDRSTCKLPSLVGENRKIHRRLPTRTVSRSSSSYRWLRHTRLIPSHLLATLAAHVTRKFHWRSGDAWLIHAVYDLSIRHSFSRALCALKNGLNGRDHWSPFNLWWSSKDERKSQNAASCTQAIGVHKIRDVTNCRDATLSLCSLLFWHVHPYDECDFMKPSHDTCMSKDAHIEEEI